MSSPAFASQPAVPAVTDCDVLVVGGGINGCGIARDLAGRGWRVVLCERDDLAAHTSSASTKLIHGGLRYLEYYEFSLVRKALQEREGLLRSAPHIMWPLRFVMPHDAAMRPAWMVRLGLFLYDHMARREVLPGSRGVDLHRHPAGAPLKPAFARGFVYSDGWVDDARLVVLNAVDARERGATVLTRTRCVAAQRTKDAWTAQLEGPRGERSTVRARALVNAAGPWAESFLRGVAKPAAGEALATRSLRLVKGSHIVVPRLFEHDHAYIFQNPDRRIIFAIPYEGAFTLIGTTDVELHGGDPAAARIDAAEIDYLCAQANRYFRKPVQAADVVWTYSGVRPLLADEDNKQDGDPSAVTRDYLLEAQTEAAPLLSIWGGKITTFRKLAEDAADDLGRMLGGSAVGKARRAWTHGALLPGGDLSRWIGAGAELGRRPDLDFERFVAELGRRHRWLPAALARRLARAYGSRIDRVLGDAQSLFDLGVEVAPGLYDAELRHLQRDEWAASADDVLWRRSKLGLHLDAAARERVAAWFATPRAAAAPAPRSEVA
ncbi:MAG TPA: glycerol-3-phosphate dehydrogenase [Methylibium sp.]|uniref:glycerol-3-phosphate dehydrogenase n=1 Tax=Methylibium sp. TaxID=2067992 RepID=UPI002DBA785D|nr:glycerol-3-phosphate dehydrogenase [Methylibium sp.]HEU4458462.1 glycerol-3-phosphate dehydrogenase [Methylibium sp.]